MNLQQRWDLYHAQREEARALSRIERPAELVAAGKDPVKEGAIPFEILDPNRRVPE